MSTRIFVVPLYFTISSPRTFWVENSKALQRGTDIRDNIKPSFAVGSCHIDHGEIRQNFTILTRPQG